MARLELDGVEVHIKGRIVSGPITLSIREGEALMLVGPNGAGKTSLLKAIAGLLPYKGRIHLEGTPAYIPQRDLLLPWLTLRDNMALPLLVKGKQRGEAYRITEKIATRLGLIGYLNVYPSQASGGTRRKASVARGLIAGADILLMDEPFVGVDAAGLGAIINMLEALKGDGYSMIIVTHQIHLVARIADRAAILLPPPQGLAREYRLRGLSPGERYSVADEIVGFLSTNIYQGRHSTGNPGEARETCAG